MNSRQQPEEGSMKEGRRTDLLIACVCTMQVKGTTKQVPYDPCCTQKKKASCDHCKP